MELRIGQKVAYPNHGVCSVTAIENKNLGNDEVEVYSLRSLANNSLIFVPKKNAKAIGIRPVINSYQCERVLAILADDFPSLPADWKVRSREYNEKLQKGCIFETADVLKQLAYLSTRKPLSFREQRLLEKAKNLVVLELATVCSQPECQIEMKVEQLLEISISNHLSLSEGLAQAAGN